MIVVENVTRSHGDAVVLDDVSVRIPAGGVTSIIGPNGAGKSTLLGIMSRLDRPDSGRVLVDGMDVHRTPGRSIARRLAILRQDSTVGVRLTVRELVTFGRFPHGRGRMTAADNAAVDEAIGFLGLTELADRHLDRLSGGQRQRAFIAMVLCQETDYVLLDEPLGSLDLRHSVGLMRLLRRAATDLGRTVVVVVHDINCAAAYSDEILALRDGTIACHAPTGDVMLPDVLESIYDMPMAVHEIGGAPVAVYHG